MLGGEDVGGEAGCRSASPRCGAERSDLHRAPCCSYARWALDRCLRDRCLSGEEQGARTMDPARLTKLNDVTWQIEPTGAMRVPAVIYADEALIRGMDDKVAEQASNVASLPGIVGASFVMPDAHWGYGFPIGGVAAFDAEQGGVVSAGGVGFDISCGVRTLLTGLTRAQVEPVKRALATSLFESIPAGVGSTGKLALDAHEMTA